MNAMPCPILAETLLPGDATWPSASLALASTDWMDGLNEGLRATCLALDVALTELDPRQRPARLASEQMARLGDFTAIQRALYTHYYSSAAVSGVVAVLAETGPKEASPFFDADLVAGVMRDDRGRMR